MSDERPRLIQFATGRTTIPTTFFFDYDTREMLTGHPAIARIRSYFAAFHEGDSHDYARQWAYPAGLFADGQWVAVPDAAAMARNNDAYARAQREAGVAGGAILALVLLQRTHDRQLRRLE